tara:strand:+ start:106 stop:837 length:732 start_codon:yes stop_codon:yes gene_type:complete
MKNTAIIIPARLGAKRFPNKPLAEINNLPMLIHVLNRAKESRVGEVFIATPDNEILNLVKKNGGQCILTKDSHPTGSDRIYEAYLKKLNNKVDLIINLQGDMPNIKPQSISKLEKLMRANKPDIGTLASPLKDNEIKDKNVVKVQVESKLEENSFLIAKDFFREYDTDNKLKKIYHHIGIYAFTSIALTKYVNLARSKLEMERNLEQMRALENNMIINVGLSSSAPLSVDTEEDLKKVSKEMI